MAQGGVLGNGTKVAYSVGSPVSWQRIGQLRDVTFPGLTPDQVDVTVHGLSKFKRNMSGMIEVTDMVLEILTDLDEGTDPQNLALWDFNQSQQTVWWRVEIPVDRPQNEFTGFEFEGQVAGIVYSTTREDVQTATVTVRFDGETLARYPAGSSIIS